MYKAMGYIREPEGVDFFVDPKPLTEKEKNEISEIIAYYRTTGRKKKLAVSPVHKLHSHLHKKEHQLVK
jgi:hypothetical protein